MHHGKYIFIFEVSPTPDLRHISLWLWHLIIVNLCFVYLFINKDRKEIVSCQGKNLRPRDPQRRYSAKRNVVSVTYEAPQ